MNCCARVLKSLYNIWYNITMKNKALAERRMSLEKTAGGADTCALPARAGFYRVQRHEDEIAHGTYASSAFGGR